MTLALQLIYLLPTPEIYSSYTVKTMPFGQLCKTKANHISDSGTRIYISNVCLHRCVCVCIYLNMLSFLLTEGKGIGAFSFVLNMQSWEANTQDASQPTKDEGICYGYYFEQMPHMQLNLSILIFSSIFKSRARQLFQCTMIGGEKIQWSRSLLFGGRIP